MHQTSNIRLVHTVFVAFDYLILPFIEGRILRGLVKTYNCVVFPNLQLILFSKSQAGIYS